MEIPADQFQRERYVNFYTDYGFKRLFGSEPHKHLLMDFLNALMEPLNKGQRIVALQYLKNEQLGSSEKDRRAIYDINCVTDQGQQFIIELQRLKQRYFKDRTLFYAAAALCEQAQSGEWDYHLRPLYVVSIMDFTLDGVLKDPKAYRHDVALREAGMEEPFEREQLHFIYLEMPKFNKKSSELESHFDKWLFAIKNLSKLDRIPQELQEEIFEEFFKAAEISKMTDRDRHRYQQSLKTYLDNINTTAYAIDQAVARGKAQGIEEGIARGEKKAAVAIAKNMLSRGMALEDICAISGLSSEELQALKGEL